MSTVYRRRKPDGTLAKIYTADIWIDGDKFPRSTGETSRREAEKSANQLEAALRAELRRKYEPLSVEGALSKYWKDHAHELPSASSVQYHIQRLLEHLPPALPLAELGNSHVDSYVTKRKTQLIRSRAKGPRKRSPPQRISAATLNRELDVLQAVHSRARDLWEHPVRAISWGKHRLPPPEKRNNILSIDEARVAITLAAKKRRDLADALELSLYTGMRRNELETLVSDRVNLRERFCIVLAKRKAGQGYRERRVFLSRAAVALLAERILPDMDPTAPLFVLTNARKIWESVRAQLGRPSVRWHDIRHTHASLLGRLTKDPALVQRQLGHTQISTSMGYIHTADETALEGVDLIPALSDRRKVVALRRSEQKTADAASEGEHHHPPPSRPQLRRKVPNKNGQLVWPERVGVNEALYR